MTDYQPPVPQMRFTIEHLAEFKDVAALPAYASVVDADTAAAVLEEAARFASEVLAPINQLGDRKGVQVDSVRALPGETGVIDIAGFLQALHAIGYSGPVTPEPFKKELGGMFYRGDYETKKQKGFDMSMKGIFYIGYDPGSQQVLVNGVDSSGGAAFGTGKITGDTVTYISEGYMMGAKTKMREVMGKKSDKEGFHKFDIDTGKGFIPFGEDTCKK